MTVSTVPAAFYLSLQRSVGDVSKIMIPSIKPWNLRLTGCPMQGYIVLCQCRPFTCRLRNVELIAQRLKLICMRHSRDDCRVCRQGAPALRVGFESLVTSICNFSLQAATTFCDRLLLSCCRSSRFHAELRWGSSLSKTSAGFLRTEAGEIEYACQHLIVLIAEA